MMPEDGVDTLRGFDAIYFGSAGDPHVPDHVTLWGLRLKICQTLDQYANVRPSRLLPGIEGPLKGGGPDRLDRSDEPTSELQSLMRTSYDVFCLTNNIQKHNILRTTSHTHF